MAAIWVDPPGAAGKAAGSAGGALPGAAGGGSVFELVIEPDGAAGRGAGWSFIEEKRVLEQPAASSAASETAARPVFEKAISTLRPVRPAPPNRDFRQLLDG
jgi:hypothetical protein